MSDIQRLISGGSYCGNEVNKALRRGIIRPARDYACVDCSGQATEYDHRDYNFPLSIEPVCRGCNARRGKAIPRQWAPNELRHKLIGYCAGLRVVPWATDWCLDQIAHRVEGIEIATNGTITRFDLRPDIYPAGSAT